MRIKVLFWTLLLGSSMSVLAQGNFVYTNDNNSPNTVSAFQVSTDGSLTVIPGSPFATGGSGGNSNGFPGKITTASVNGNSFLYAGNTEDGTVSGFSINAQTGSLVLIPGSPFVAGENNTNLSLAASPNGEFLFSMDQVAGVIHVFQIVSATGALTEVAGSPFPAGANALGLKVSPNGKFLVAGLDSNVGVFAIGSQGTLTPVPGSPFSADEVTSVEVNCHGNRVFASNAGSKNQINAYQMADNGALTPVPGSPFSSGGTSVIFGVTLNPSNQFLFASNGFDDTVSSLAVDANGSLHPAPGSPFGAADFTGAISTTHDGQFVYVADFAVAEINGWSINSTGALMAVPGSPFSTGQSPLGQMTLTTFPAPSCSGQ